MSKTNIYPLNEINLQALLNYYFPFLTSGNISELFKELDKNKLTLNDLEFAAQKILPFLYLIRERLTGNLTQKNALDYAVEIFLYTNADFSDRAPERIEIIKLIRSEAGMQEIYEDMLGKENRVFLLKNWN
jgi:hypothetical protein